MIMSDVVVITAYRSPRTCAARLRLLRALNPCVQLVCIYTGPTHQASEFQRVFAICDHHYVLPTKNTKENWGNLDQAYARWWQVQGVRLNADRLLFLDWDVLLLEPATRLFNQLEPGLALFCKVFPVLDLRRDHWAREFTGANNLEPVDPCDSTQPLSRAILFAWGCYSSDFTAVADRVMRLGGYCEMRLPYSFRCSGIALRNFEPQPLPYASVSGQGLSRRSLFQLQADIHQLQLAHPVYLPITSTRLDLDWIAWLIERPFAKTLSRRLKVFLRNVALRLGLILPLNP
jgi:hypothetical protein